jgi:anti-anti-sigma factor
MVNFEYDPSEKRLTCYFSGKLDTNVCQELGTLISQKLSSLPKTGDPAFLPEDSIVFDLKETTFISSTFIRICMQAYRQAQKGKFSIINSTPFIKKTFKISGLDEMLRVS